MLRRGRIWYLLVVLIAVAGAAWGGVGPVLETGSAPSPAAPTALGPSTVPNGSRNRPAGVPAEAQEGRVAKIVDGDTIWVSIGSPGGAIPVGKEHRVRMLEIDTPETVRPNYQVQCGGGDATAFARAELPVGSAVYLMADEQDKDGFGRFLRYVWDFEGEFYNQKAVAEGYARAVLYRPNDRYIDRMREAEALAKQAGKGVWGKACAQAHEAKGAGG